MCSASGAVSCFPQDESSDLCVAPGASYIFLARNADVSSVKELCDEGFETTWIHRGDLRGLWEVKGSWLPIGLESMVTRRARAPLSPDCMACGSSQ